MSARPMLADVLAALTAHRDAAAWGNVGRGDLPALLPDGNGAILRVASWSAVACPWAHTSPADALAALVEAGLVAEHWLDAARAPRWWCEACGGSGLGDVDPEQGCGTGARATTATPPPRPRSPPSSQSRLSASPLSRASRRSSRRRGGRRWRGG